MTEKYQNETINEKKKDIFIKKEAFRNMLTHVLRFGNDSLERSVEVLGVCIGRYDPTDDRVIIENAVPITNGDKVEIGFDKEIHEIFDQIGKKYSSPLLGYYHSHPSWGLYLSESDLKNIQYFQNENTSYGFSIVFDHTLMGKDGSLGFEIFRLDDYLKPENYHSVPFEIELPNSLEYFKWVQKFSEDFQKKTPILIKEINEFIEPIPRDLQEIPISEDIQAIEGEIKEFPELTSIELGFNEGTAKISEMLIEITKNQVGAWIKDIDQGTAKGSEYINKAVNKMNEAISSGMIKVDNWFKKTLNDSINEFKKNASNYVDLRVNNNKELMNKISDTKIKMIDSLKTLIDNESLEIKTEMGTIVNTMNEKVTEVNQLNLEFKEKLNDLNSYILNLDEQLNSLAENIKNKAENSMNSLQVNSNEKMEKLNSELIPFKEFNNEIKMLLEKLQKIITGFRNLTQK